jgi:hypothetical protein
MEERRPIDFGRGLPTPEELGMEERLPVIRLTSSSFREWVVECEKNTKGRIISCKTIVDAEMPQTLQNGVEIKSRKGDFFTDLIKLRDGQKLLYTI